jgi:hypothetical protein
MEARRHFARGTPFDGFFRRIKSSQKSSHPRFRLYSRYDPFVSLRQRGMAHMVFSPALRHRKDTTNTQVRSFIRQMTQANRLW